VDEPSSDSARVTLAWPLGRNMRRGGLPNNELQRTSDGTAAGSPLNSVLGGRNGVGCEFDDPRV
jgi:hypothetical protein